MQEKDIEQVKIEQLKETKLGDFLMLPEEGQQKISQILLDSFYKNNLIDKEDIIIPMVNYLTIDVGQRYFYNFTIGDKLLLKEFEITGIRSNVIFFKFVEDLDNPNIVERTFHYESVMFDRIEPKKYNNFLFDTNKYNLKSRLYRTNFNDYYSNISKCTVNTYRGQNREYYKSVNIPLSVKDELFPDYLLELFSKMIISSYKDKQLTTLTRNSVDWYKTRQDLIEFIYKRETTNPLLIEFLGFNELQYF